MKLLKKSNKGFTIIEVLLVLAIAGSILLVILLAAPNLQRNARNNTRKSDVGRIAAAVNEWVANNNGATFTAGASNVNLTSVITNVGTLNAYTLTAGTNFSVAAVPNSGTQAKLNTTAPVTDQVVVLTNATCGTDGAATGLTSNPRSMAIQYLTETGGNGFAAQCQNI